MSADPGTRRAMPQAGPGRRRLLSASAAALALAPLAGCGLFDDDEKPITPGHREDVLPAQIGLRLDPSLAQTAVALPPPEPDAQWLQPGRVATHLMGNPDWSGSDKPAFSVKFGLGQALRSQLTAPPLVADGRVYTMDAAAVIDAFDLRTGRNLWKLQTRPKTVRSSAIGGGITLGDGVLYAATGLAEAIAIDPSNGRIKWRQTTVTPVRSPPTYAEGRLFFGLIDERLLALDATDGHLLWSYQATTSFNAVLGQPAPAFDHGVVVAGFGSGEIAALGALDGSLIWSDQLGGSAGASPLEFASIVAAPVIDGETVYAISVGGLMTATDMRTGRRVWERAVGGGSTPAVIGDWLFLLTTDQTVACLERSTGHVRWASVLPRFAKPKSRKQPILWNGPLLAGGHLVLVGSSAQMVLLDPSDGSIGGDRKLASPASLVPIAAEGSLLLMTDDGKLNAYR